MRKRHYVNEMDNWYSCPKSGECLDDSAGDECNCGAEEINAYIEGLERKLSKYENGLSVKSEAVLQIICEPDPINLTQRKRTEVGVYVSLPASYKDQRVHVLVMKEDNND